MPITPPLKIGDQNGDGLVGAIDMDLWLAAMQDDVKAGGKYETDGADVNRLHTNKAYQKDLAKTIVDDADAAGADTLWVGENHDPSQRDNNYDLVANLSNAYKAKGETLDVGLEIEIDYKVVFDKLNASEYKSVGEFANAFIAFAEGISGFKLERSQLLKRAKAYWTIHQNGQNIYCIDETQQARQDRKTNPDNIKKAAEEDTDTYLVTDPGREQLIADNVAALRQPGHKLLILSGQFHNCENSDYDLPATVFAEKCAARRAAETLGHDKIYSVSLVRMDNPDFPSDDHLETSKLPLELQTGTPDGKYWDALYML